MHVRIAVVAASVTAFALLAQNSAQTPSPQSQADELIVTARYREESLQEVPVAVSLVGGVLRDCYTVNTQQLSQLVPSLYYNWANPSNTAYTIRALGSNTLSISAANDGIEPGVAFYADQVYHGRPATASFDFTDIERIEVLRGPQGTLFGKNTAAGAIHVISRAPTFKPSRTQKSPLETSTSCKRKAASHAKLADKIAGRLSAQLTRRDGLVQNVRTGEKLNELNNYAVRAQLLVEPTERVELRLIADFSDLDSQCCTQNLCADAARHQGSIPQGAPTF